MKKNQEQIGFDKNIPRYDVLANSKEQARQAMARHLNDAGWMMSDLSICAEYLKSISLPIVITDKGYQPDLVTPVKPDSDYEQESASL
jgi:hypothetical protein